MCMERHACDTDHTPALRGMTHCRHPISMSTCIHANNRSCSQCEMQIMTLLRACILPRIRIIVHEHIWQCAHASSCMSVYVVHDVVPVTISRSPPLRYPHRYRLHNTYAYINISINTCTYTYINISYTYTHSHTSTRMHSSKIASHTPRHMRGNARLTSCDMSCHATAQMCVHMTRSGDMTHAMHTAFDIQTVHMPTHTIKPHTQHARTHAHATHT